MTVNEYRKKHRRCRTCKHAYSYFSGWVCKAKNKRGYYSLVESEGLKGMFCRVYEAKEGADNG